MLSVIDRMQLVTQRSINIVTRDEVLRDLVGTVDVLSWNRHLNDGAQLDFVFFHFVTSLLVLSSEVT